MNHPSPSLTFNRADTPPEPATAAPMSNTAAHQLLEGPHSRIQELLLVLHAVRDFIRGFRKLHFVGPSVTVFGSARYGEDSPYYSIARAVGQRLSTMGFTVMTGGGPGLMEAANRGAKDVGGMSIGCNIRLPKEQLPNRYLDRWVTCEHFFVRKVLLFKYSYAFVALPGGFGTMDELFEALTLIQNRKVARFPVVLIGTAFWQPLVRTLDAMATAGTIDAADLRLLVITDDLDVAMQHLERDAVLRFRLRELHRPRALRWLGERPAIAIQAP
ncbi:MAG TPA: TIGR00730 family Rossman fold protein [Gemmatimonadales bacterium]|jgi:hypothetical protein